MKFLKHLFPGKTSSLFSNTKPVKPKSFGQKRAQDMNNAFNKAVQQRRELIKKEFTSPDPLNKIYQQKGRNLDVRIRNLKDSY